VSMFEVLKIQFNCYPFLSILGGSVSWISSWSKKMNKEPFLEKIVVSLNMQWLCKLCNSLRLLLCLLLQCTEKMPHPCNFPRFSVCHLTSLMCVRVFFILVNLCKIATYISLLIANKTATIIENIICAVLAKLN